MEKNHHSSMSTFYLLDLMRINNTMESNRMLLHYYHSLATLLFYTNRSIHWRKCLPLHWHIWLIYRYSWSDEEHFDIRSHFQKSSSHDSLYNHSTIYITNSSLILSMIKYEHNYEQRWEMIEYNLEDYNHVNEYHPTIDQQFSKDKSNKSFIYSNTIKINRWTISIWKNSRE